MRSSRDPRNVWWKRAQYYQIWPKSFCDSNGDGIGDLRGIISKVPYLKSLGIDVIWINPFYPSPNKDNGYDISDYRSIDPAMGTMEDFEELVKVVHSHDMKVLPDLVVNHCSDQHEWFIKSCKGDPKYKDYFIWRDGRGKDGMDPPNNWGSVFAGPAWKYVPERGQFYYHTFATEQPDLNWDNPAVREEIVDIIRFWNAKGIDGFRLDATCHISKPPGMPDYDTTEPFFRGHMHSNGPRMHEYIRVITDAIHEREGNVCFGEMGSVPMNEIDLSTAPDRKEMDMVILFEHTGIDFSYHHVKGKFDYHGMKLCKLKKYINMWYSNIKEGWINLYLCNHDQPRVVSRWGDVDNHWAESAKMFGMLYHFMRGSPFIFQGEEIGMTNWKFEMEEADDIEFKRFYQVLVKEKALMTHDHFMQVSHKIGRDTARTPVHWSANENAGFSSSKPWLPVNEDYTRINVESQIKDPNSVWNFYRNMIRIRKEHGVLIAGEFEQILDEQESLFGYKRYVVGEKEVYFAFFNLTGYTFELYHNRHFPQYSRYEVVLCNYENYSFDPARIEIKPYLGVLLQEIYY